MPGRDGTGPNGTGGCAGGGRGQGGVGAVCRGHRHVRRRGGLGGSSDVTVVCHRCAVFVGIGTGDPCGTVCALHDGDEAGILIHRCNSRLT